MNLEEPKGPPPESGNHFGWRFSFFGLSLIVFTIAMYTFIGEGNALQKNSHLSGESEELEAVEDTIRNDAN